MGHGEKWTKLRGIEGRKRGNGRRVFSFPPPFGPFEV
jgi:hypothetical protein